MKFSALCRWYLWWRGYSQSCFLASSLGPQTVSVYRYPTLIWKTRRWSNLRSSTDSYNMPRLHGIKISTNSLLLTNSRHLLSLQHWNSSLCFMTFYGLWNGWPTLVFWHLLYTVKYHGVFYTKCLIDNIQGLKNAIILCVWVKGGYFRSDCWFGFKQLITCID